MTSALLVALSIGISAKTLYNDCDIINGFWGAPAPAASCIEGRNCISMEDSGGCAIFCYAPTVDVSDYVENGYFGLHVYVSDASLVGYAELELTSAGYPDTSEIHWSLGGLSDGGTERLKTGWNELKLYFEDGTISGGTPNYSALNYFRFFMYHTAGVPLTVAIDDMYFDNPTDTYLYEIPDGFKENTLSLQSCDTLNGIWGTDIVLKGSGAPEGTGYVTASGFCPVVCSLINKDISEYKDGGVSIRVYVENKDLLQLTSNPMGKIELYSNSMTMWWPLCDIDLQNGWNTIYLPFSMAHGTLDFTNVTSFRIFQYASSHVTIGVDDLKVYTFEAVPEEENTRTPIQTAVNMVLYADIAGLDGEMIKVADSIVNSYSAITGGNTLAANLSRIESLNDALGFRTDLINNLRKMLSRR